MQQRWWLIAVAVIGVGLAIVLVPRPDTGDLPEPPPTPERTIDMPEPAKKGPERIPGPPPGAEKQIAIRKRPAAQTARELAAPLGAIRYTLRSIGDEGKEMADRVGVLQQELANVPSNEDADLDDIIERLAPLMEELESAYGDNSDVETSIARYNKGVDEWNSLSED